MTRLALSLTVLWILMGCAVWFLLRASLVHEYDQSQQAKAETIATLVSERGGRVEFDFADEIMPEYSRTRDPEYFELRSGDETVIERSRSLRSAALQLPPLDDGVGNWDLLLPDGRRGRATAFRFVPQTDSESSEQESEPVPPRPVLPLTLVLAASRESVDQALVRVTLWIVISAVTISAVGAVLVHTTVARGLEPLMKFSEAVQAVTLSSVHSEELLSPLPTELEPVRERLVHTLRRLAAAFEREKRFAVAAAHELRTPIAELRSMAQYSLRWPEDPDQARRTNEEILALSQRMERLVIACLAIARSQAVELAKEPIDLNVLVRELWQPLVANATDRGLSWEFAVRGQPQVVSDRALLGTLILNLFTNALEHSRLGGQVRVMTEATQANLTLVVENDCSGLDAADIEHVFEPFWRKARLDNQHTGLGLTLALALADALSMTLQAELRDAVFITTLWIPCGDS